MNEPQLTHEEIAAIMTERGHRMNRSAVWQTEQRALAKLRRELEGTEYEPDERRA